MSTDNPKKASRRSIKIPLALGALSVLAGVAPLIAMFVASSLADHYGCRLHEGFSNPCVIAGVDRGETLYSLFVTGWLGLISIPLGALGLLLAMIFAIRAIWHNARLDEGRK